MRDVLKRDYLITKYLLGNSVMHTVGVEIHVMIELVLPLKAYQPFLHQRRVDAKVYLCDCVAQVGI